MEKGPVHVIACGDRNVLWGIAVTMRSALENASGPLAITIIGSGFTKADREMLEASWVHPNTHSVRIQELDYDKIKKFRSTKYLTSKLTYARYFVDDNIPDADCCIYLDSDLIVLRDMHELANIPLDGNTVGAVLDISTRANDGQVELCRKLGITDPSKYFNTGVILFDLARYRAEGDQQKLIDVSLDLFDKLDAQDQAAINVVMQGKAKILDVAWNTIQYEAPADFDNGVLHLIGMVKPWHYDYDYKFKDLFFDYLDRTAYKGQRPAAPGSVGALRTRIARKVPTRDMVVGKVRRMLGRYTAS